MIKSHTELTVCVSIRLVVVLAFTRLIVMPPTKASFGKARVETKDLRRWSTGHRCRAVVTRLQRTGQEEDD